MRQLAYSVDRRASILEAIIPGMIERDIVNFVTPLSFTIDCLVTHIVVREQGQGVNKKVTTQKSAIVELRRDVDQLKSTDMSVIFGRMEILHVPVDPDVPSTTTRDEAQPKEVLQPRLRIIPMRSCLLVMKRSFMRVSQRLRRSWKMQLCTPLWSE